MSYNSYQKYQVVYGCTVSSLTSTLSYRKKKKWSGINFVWLDKAYCLKVVLIVSFFQRYVFLKNSVINIAKIKQNRSTDKSC